MGGRISNLFGSTKRADDDKQLEWDPDELEIGGLGNPKDKQRVLWYQRLFYDKRFRIAYVIILALLLGLIIPIIIFASNLETKSKPIYGSCLIKEHARFQCLPNSPTPVTEDQCVKALCCWENAADLPFQCYHSFPSAYQYNVSTIRKYTENINPARNDSIGAVGTWNELDVRASHPEMMSPLRIITHWETDEHLVVEIFNRNKFPGRASPKPSTKAGKKTRRQETQLPFDLSWGQLETLFFLRIGRTETNETIFDTRLGPVFSGSKDITLSTLLPTPFFYGMKGGQGSSSLATVTYSILNGFENAEFPFYISFESSGKWHGVLIDTTSPILAQVVQAPGIMLQLESDKPELNLHFFAGPTQPHILQQLHAFIRKKSQIESSHYPMIPPYWGLGLHLCRKLDNGTLALEHIQDLHKDSDPLSYDSDCIDEYMRHPLSIDNATHPDYLLEETLKLLKTKDKRIVLSQKSTVRVDNPDTNLPKELLVVDTQNSSDLHPFQGQLSNLSVNYINYFDPYFTTTNYPPEPALISGDLIPCHGFSLDDNFPKVDNVSAYCPAPKTLLQSYFTRTFLSTSDDSLNTTLLWGSLCPTSTGHSVNASTKSLENHLSLHNVYGETSLKTVHRSIKERNQQEMLISSGSYWISSLYYGAFQGMQAPFTWKGLQASMENAVRNFALAPVSGTSICGAILSNNITFDMNSELCIRWFQFGLLLPFARNTYDGYSSFGPIHLLGQFRDYLNGAIRTRYSLAPYYYTQFRAYQTSYVPLVTPIGFHFHAPNEVNQTLPELTQFMLGDAIMAVPIFERGTNRRCYFPSGKWFGFDGVLASNTATGESRQISGILPETPMFIRGGYMIPTLQSPQGQTIEDSLQGNYTLITAVSNNQGGQQTANGSLIVKDPELQTDHLLDFSTVATSDEIGKITIVVKINSTCATSADPTEPNPTPSVSTIIDNLRVFGFDFMGALDIRISDGTSTHPPKDFQYFGDHYRLTIRGLNVDWCSSSNWEITVIQKCLVYDDECDSFTTLNPTTETTEKPGTGDTMEPTSTESVVELIKKD